MKRKVMLAFPIIAAMLALTGNYAASAQDKCAVKCRMGSRSPNSEDTTPGSWSPSARTEALLRRSWLIL